MDADLPARAGAALGSSGLILHGGLNFRHDEQRPPGPNGTAAGSVLLVGNAGAGHWPEFLHWQERQARPVPHPLDAWSREVIEAAAATVGARVAMPGDRPFAPFQRWAMRAAGLKPSPLGILIHPRFGLWHAFRGALLFDCRISDQALRTLNRHAGPARHPCDSCAEKPCLKSCPVQAHTPHGFDAAACAAHLRTPGGAACMAQGCRARNACPQGLEWRYPAKVQRFHQHAFAPA